MTHGAALLLLLSGPSSTVPAQQPDCQDRRGHTSEAWSTQSRNALASRTRYPPRAAREGMTGTAKLLIDVDWDGRLHGVSIAKTSGEPLLDEAALDAARAVGRFAALPCLTTERIRVVIPVRFVIRN
ncbi:energy transducer TonB [Sphingomonas sp. ac-8]|uniref:energy transducer TonB family protein n=1 Tax=Sphingomonas sp. ac-8 TaxID=3242977 RepID=UPI003A80857C